MFFQLKNEVILCLNDYAKTKCQSIKIKIFNNNYNQSSSSLSEWIKILFDSSSIFVISVVSSSWITTYGFKRKSTFSGIGKRLVFCWRLLRDKDERNGSDDSSARRNKSRIVVLRSNFLVWCSLDPIWWKGVAWEMKTLLITTPIYILLENSFFLNRLLRHARDDR